MRGLKSSAAFRNSVVWLCRKWCHQDLVTNSGMTTLTTSSRGRRNTTFAATALAGDRLWTAFPQAMSGPAAAPFRLFDGLTSRAALSTALMAGGVAVLVRGAPVLYDVHATAAAVAAGAHIAKVL